MAPLVPVVPSCPPGGTVSRARRLLRAGIAVLLLGWCVGAQALAPDRALSQLRHDRWTPEQGAPAQVMSIAQTPDGFLWLGSRQGLYRFDGMRFERITRIAGERIVDDDVLSLFVDRDGSLWVGYVSGGMGHLGGAHPANYAYQRDDVPAGSVLGFGRDAAGRLWAATAGTVVFLDPASDTWQAATDMGFDPAWSPQRLFVDRDKGLWVAFSDATQSRIAHLAPGASRFEIVPPAIDQPFFDQAPDGSLWVADESGVRPLQRALPVAGRPGTAISWLAADFKGAGLRFDRDGVMWLANENGIARLRDPTTLRPPDGGHRAPWPETFGTAQGLTSEVVWTLFEDREGNLWAGTANGLDRFRANALAAIALPRRDQAFSVEVDGEGGIWAANPDRGPMRVAPDADQPGGARVQEIAGAEAGVTALHRDAAGTLWVGDADGGLWRSTAGGLQAVPLPAEVVGAGRIVMIASDRGGALWVSKLNAGLLRLERGKWEAQNARLGIAAGTTPRTLAEDAQGRIWTDAGQTIRVFARGGHHDFEDAGPGVGRIAVLRAWKDELWIGGVQGVAAHRGERFQRLLGQGGERFERTAGIVMLGNGEAWLLGRPGVTRVSAAEMARWRAQPTYRVAFTRYGVRDGLRGAAEQSGASPVAVADARERVWFATSRGIHWIDPRALAAPGDAGPTITPAVLALQVDGKAVPLAPAPTLPVGSRDLRIDYTAPFLGRPEQARFRYRLDGLDDDWHEAGMQRQALYSRLAPGRYRFRLMASDGNGAWRGPEASMGFVVQPAFWQTGWFALACAVAALLLVWALVRWRVAVARAGMQRVYRARIVERERIARDLHDTLLQSMQALVFLVDAARGRLERGDDEAARAGLSRAVREANAGLVEGRDRIRELRREQAAPPDFDVALAALPRQLAMPPGLSYEFSRRGGPVRWQAAVQEEVYRIVREAVANAVRHAGAAHIRVSVSAGWLGVRVEVRDDGCGIDAELMARGNREGHWGLTGMRERARLIGARLTVASRAGRGTSVRLLLPRWRAARRGAG